MTTRDAPPGGARSADWFANKGRSVDLVRGRCDALVAEDQVARRRAEGARPVPPSHTRREELCRATVSQLAGGAVLEMATHHRGISRELPRHNH